MGTDTPDPERPRTLARLIASRGVASRKKSEQIVRDGRVEVDGVRTTDPERWVDPSIVSVRIDGKPLPARPTRRVILVHKPRGVEVTEAADSEHPAIGSLFPGGRLPDGCHAVGRLDRASAGLLLLTNDSEFAARLLDPKHHVSKTYHVKLSPIPAAEVVESWRRGADIGDDTPTRPARAEVIRENPKSAVVEIELREGRNRQIRRLAERAGLEVGFLVRVRFGPVALGDLPAGASRELSAAEIAELERAATGDDSGRVA